MKNDTQTPDSPRPTQGGEEPLDLASCSPSFPEFTGKYFAIYRGEPAILIIEETYMEIVYADGEKDPIYSDDDELESWVDAEKLFKENAQCGDAL